MSRPDHVLPAPVQAADLPEVTNHTPWPSQYYQQLDTEGQAFHVLVCRTSYSLRGMDFSGSEPPTPLLLDFEDQPPLCETDAYAGELNTSSVLQESDFALYKPRCDVLVVNAVAFAPEGKAQRRWPVGFGFGTSIKKVLQICGPRHFEALNKAGTRWRLAEPALAVEVPLCWELACGGPQVLDLQERLSAGGTDPAVDTGQQAKRAAALAKLPPHHLANPIGCGRDPQKLWAGMRETADALGEPLPSATTLPAPQNELLDRPFRGERDYPAVGFGPIGRWWAPRLALAGTHDEAWKATQWPLSPRDHDYHYWNCAPEDQQIDYPQGGEVVSLLNLTPGGGVVRFVLPRQDLQLLVRLQVGAVMFAPMHIDTVVIDVGNACLSVVRRALVSAKADVRALELGTWPQGTALALPPRHPAAQGGTAAPGSPSWLARTSSLRTAVSGSSSSRPTFA